jgi:tetratricopeptide (TPR) repeat protein
MANIKKINGVMIFFIILCLAVLAIAANRFRLYYAKTAVEQGEIAVEQGDYDRAIAQFTRAIKLGYEKDSSLNWRGIAYYVKLDNDMAIADFAKAIKLRPDYDRYYMWCGRAYRAKGEYDIAIAYFTDAIKIDSLEYTGLVKSYDSDLYVERGDVYTDKGDYALAIQDYNQAIAAIYDTIAAHQQFYKEHPGEVAVVDFDQNTQDEVDKIVAKRSHAEWLLTLETIDFSDSLSDEEKQRLKENDLSDEQIEYMEMLMKLFGEPE